METNNINIARLDRDLFNTSTTPENYTYDLETTLSGNNNQGAIQSDRLLFIDSAIEDYQVLTDNLVWSTEVVILDSQRDGIVQITDAISQYENLDAIHIVSHGDVGELSLGNAKLNSNSIYEYDELLSSWNNYLKEDGDILLYGCNVGAGLTGREFVEGFSQYTAVDISASTDLTGSESLGGDWDLEYATGDIEESIAFDAEIQSSYQHILFGLDTFSGSYSGTNFSDFSGSDFYFDSNINFDTDFDFDYNFDSDFDFDTSIDLPNPSEPDNTVNIDLEQYDFSDPAYNTVLLNFEPSQINFNANDFDFDSVDINNNSITFGFTSGVDFAPSAESIESLEFDFDNYTFDFESKFSFNADSVTFEKDRVKFEFDSNSLNFQVADLFSAKKHLFEYKFLNNEITLPNGEITFADLNASDFRALDYAYPGDELFDGEYYFATNIIPDDMNPFTDYVENGYKAGRNPNGLFDVDYYLNTNTDVKKDGMDPLLHYALHGFTENFDSRDPNPLFDSSYYNAKNPDVVAEGMNPLLHYMQFGWKESRINNPKGFNPNRDPSPFFDTSFYFDKHNDVLNASYFYDSANPVQHYLEFGNFGLYANENRTTHQASETQYTARISRRFTPDSDPEEILNLQKDLKKDGYKLEKIDDKSFEIGLYDRFIDDKGNINIFEPIEDAWESLVIGGLALTFYVGIKIKDGIVESAQYFEDGFDDVGKAVSFSGYTGIPLKSLSTDAVTIDYGDSSLSDLLGTRPFPGQTESQRVVEIFTTPDIDGLEDFTIFPDDSGIFLPTTTEFPQRDETLEAILNGGLFLGGEETPQGAYFYAADKDGGSLYDPTDPFYEGATFYDNREPSLDASSYEDARNIALERLGEIDPSTREKVTGRIGIGKGKTVGFKTVVDGVPKTYRVDYDPDKGPHINIDVGKRIGRKKLAIEFPGSEADVDIIYKDLAR